VTKREQTKDGTSAEALEQAELDEAQLEDVNGGAGFLTGSLTAEQGATAWVNPGGNANGIIMKDSIIVRTSGR
jgi:hypothetical protein